MTRRSKESSTVVTSDSSLRNLDYEPSIQEESIDDEQTHSDGESALSSVLSSVKRDLKARASQGAFSSHSVATSQSKSTVMWQDSESDAELYSTDEERVTSKGRGQNHHGTTSNCERAKTTSIRATRNRIECQESESLESTEDPTSESENSQQSAVDNVGETVPAKLLVEPNDLTSEAAAISKPKPKLKVKEASTPMKSKKQAKKSARKGEPRKRLRFSKESLAEVAKARIDRDRHELRPKRDLLQEPKVERLDNVDYVSQVDIASTNQDISTLHSLDKDDCEPVFQNRVPYEVPMSQANYSYDDMSSIHPLSTRMPSAIQNSQDNLDCESDDIEECATKAIPAKEPELKLLAKHDDAEPVSTVPQRQRRWIRGNRTTHSSGEIILAVVAGVSLAALVILFILLLAT